jgi:hypothetical protein
LKEDAAFCFGSMESEKLDLILFCENSAFWLVIIATFISLNLKVYDTQCGCKVFTKDLSTLKNSSKMAFDVEYSLEWWFFW